MLLKKNREKKIEATDLLNFLFLDYMKSCSIIFGINLSSSNLISVDEIPLKIKEKVFSLNNIEFLELMLLVETIEDIHNKEDFFLKMNNNIFRNIFFVIPFPVAYQFFYLKENDFFLFINKYYPNVTKILEFLFIQTKLEYENFKKGIFNTGNYKKIYEEFEKLRNSEDIKKFLNDFIFLSKNTLLKKISELYKNSLLTKKVEKYTFKQEMQTSQIILNKTNILTSFSYVASKMIGCGGNSNYTIMDFSNILLIDNYGQIIEEANNELVPLNNFSIFRRNIVCHKNVQIKILHFIREIAYKNLVNNAEEDEKKAFFDFIEDSNMKHLLSSSENTSALLSIFFYIDIRNKYEKASEEIQKEAIEILKKNIPFEYKIIELELYLSDVVINLFENMKLKNQKENSLFYIALQKFLQKKIVALIEEAFLSD